VIVTGFGESSNLVSEISSKMKPRFRAEWEVSSEELCILASWFFSQMNKNSVLEELRVRRLVVWRLKNDILCAGYIVMGLI